MFKPEAAPEILAILHQTGFMDYAREQAAITPEGQENLQFFPESIEKGVLGHHRGTPPPHPLNRTDTATPSSPVNRSGIV